MATNHPRNVQFTVIELCYLQLASSQYEQENWGRKCWRLPAFNRANNSPNQGCWYWHGSWNSFEFANHKIIRIVFLKVSCNKHVVSRLMEFCVLKLADRLTGLVLCCPFHNMISVSCVEEHCAAYALQHIKVATAPSPSLVRISVKLIQIRGKTMNPWCNVLQA